MQMLRTASLWFNFTGSYKKKSVRSAFKVFILHVGHCDSSSFFLLKKHAVKQFKQKLCSHFNTFIGFQVKSGGISSNFIWEEMKLKKLWIQVESLTSFLVCLSEQD